MTVTRTYIICATMRSGSTLLCSLLNQTQCAGAPGEFLRDHLRDGYTISDNEYVSLVRQRLAENASANGVSGVKLMWWNFDALRKRARKAIEVSKSIPDEDALKQVFPNLKFVFITRSDKIGQSISLCRAVKTKVWYEEEDKQNQKPKTRFPKITNFHIRRNIDFIEECEKSWEDFFKTTSLPVHRVSYENLSLNYTESIPAILTFLGVLENKCNISTPNLRKQRDFYSSLIALKYKLFMSLPKSWQGLF